LLQSLQLLCLLIYLYQRHPDLLVLEGVGLELQLLGKGLQLLLQPFPLLLLLIYLTLATP
jgi:hypothetical protein